MPKPFMFVFLTFFLKSVSPRPVGNCLDYNTPKISTGVAWFFSDYLVYESAVFELPHTPEYDPRKR